MHHELLYTYFCTFLMCLQYRSHEWNCVRRSAIALKKNVIQIIGRNPNYPHKCYTNNSPISTLRSRFSAGACQEDPREAFIDLGGEEKSPLFYCHDTEHSCTVVIRVHLVLKSCLYMIQCFWCRNPIKDMWRDVLILLCWSQHFDAKVSFYHVVSTPRTSWRFLHVELIDI